MDRMCVEMLYFLNGYLETSSLYKEMKVSRLTKLSSFHSQVYEMIQHRFFSDSGPVLLFSC